MIWLIEYNFFIVDITVNVHINDIPIHFRIQCADFFAVELNTVVLSGGASVDPVAALVMCTPASARYTVVNGRFIVKDGRVVTLDLPKVIEQCNRASRKIVNP